MRLARLGFTLVLMLASSTALAQMRICQQRFLTGADRAKFNRAVAAVVPPGFERERSVGVCRNGADADAHLDTRHKTMPEGFEVWYAISCTRNGEWSCATELKQLLRTEESLAGKTQKVRLLFDAPLGMAEARALLSRAFTVVNSGEPVKACPAYEGATTAEDSKGWTGLRNSALHPRERSLEVRASRGAGGGYEVDLYEDGPIALSFEFLDHGWTCFLLYIVVT